MKTPKEKTTNLMKSLLKAVLVIGVFTPEELELGPAEVARKVGIPKTTAQRILTTLSSSGLLTRNEETRKYTVGALLYSQGCLFLRSTDVLKAAQPVVKLLNVLTDETVALAIYDNGHITYTMKEDSKSAVRFSVPLGLIRPAYASAMGKAFLSELTEAELNRLYPDEKLVPVTSKTVTTKTKLKEQLGQIRNTGISYSREENYEGVEGFAALIRNASGSAVAAINIGMPVYKSNDNLRERMATLISMGVNLISYRLGYTDLAHPVSDINHIRSWWGEK